MVLKSNFQLKVDDLQLDAVGSVEGLASTTKHKVIHDNAKNSRPRVIVGTESHENVILKCNVLSLTEGQATQLNEKRENHRVNDGSESSISRVSISFFKDTEHNEDAGQYLCTGCKIVGLKLDTAERENENDPLMMEIEFAVAEGGWAN